MTPEQIAESRRICEAATPGPYTVGFRLSSDGWPLFSLADMETGLEPEARRVARFFEHARTALPAALDALDAAEQRAQAAEDELKTAYWCLGPDYDGEWEVGPERRSLDSLVTEVVAARVNAEANLDELRREVERLRATVSAEVGGEKPGDTLVRLAGLIVGVRNSKEVPAEDWKQWLRDFGARMNHAAEAAKEKP